MIEQILKEYLEETLDLPVVMEVPAKQPDEFVLVEKTGSSEHETVCFATVVIQSYAASMYGAAALNERVKRAMDDIILRNDVFLAVCDSDYNYTDTTKKEYRYQAVYTITYFESED